MKDLPLFPTEYGIASLILREIPYRAAAYVRIQAAEDLKALLLECTAFCRAAGAEKIYASGHPGLEKYPLHTAIWQMSCQKENLADTAAVLRPVQEETVEEWRNIYNQRMVNVPNAAWMTLEGAEDMLSKGDGYFVHRGDTLLGIGRAAGNRIDVVISCVPGAGREVLLALSRVITGTQIILEVASANTKAVRLYQQMGFVPTAELSRWYQIK